MSLATRPGHGPTEPPDDAIGRRYSAEQDRLSELRRIDMALDRCRERLRRYREPGNETSLLVERGVADRLLAERHAITDPKRS